MQRLKLSLIELSGFVDLGWKIDSPIAEDRKYPHHRLMATLFSAKTEEKPDMSSKYLYTVKSQFLKENSCTVYIILTKTKQNESNPNFVK